MSDTTVTTETPVTPPPLPNDAAARSPTGEILDASTPTTPPKTETPPSESKTSPDSSQTTSSSEPPKPDDKKPDASKTGAPEAYTEFTLPEGLKLAPETLEAATPIFKELGLSQEQAQRLVSFHADQLKAASAAAQEASYTEMRADWRTKTLADTDIKSYSLDGKTGMDAVKVDIGRALGTLDPTLRADFQAAMDLTGAGDHPAFVKAMWRLSQAISEGRPVSGKGPSPHGQTPPGSKPPTAAQALYPNLPSAG